MHTTGFVQRGLPRSSPPKNAAAPLYQLTDAKAHAQRRRKTTRPPTPPCPSCCSGQWATGAIAVGKWKRDTDDDDHWAYVEDDDEDEDGGNSGSD